MRELEQCLLCGGAVEVLYQSQYGVSVSSENALLQEDITLYECRLCGHLQKLPSERVLAEIYGNYQIDTILPYMEQVKFDTDGGKSCSERVVENCAQYLKPERELKILDYGAGGGQC